MPDVNEIKDKGDAIFIHSGSPHHICFVNGLDQFDVFSSGRAIRYRDVYSEGGTNVNFVEPVSENKIFVRTYERGVEDETLSCGTGVTASAIAYGLQNGRTAVEVKTLGGDLEIRFKKIDNDHITDIYLIGPAQMVFEGDIDLRNF
jgi:diaminopimelate epimerase